MGGIVIDIWEKSNFLGHLDHKKVPKMRLLFRAGIKSPPSCRVKWVKTPELFIILFILSQGYTGDPFVSCRPFEKKDLCNPNPCGPGAQCQAGFDRYVHKND